MGIAGSRLLMPAACLLTLSCAPGGPAGNGQAGSQAKGESTAARPDREGPFGIRLGSPLDSVPGITRGDDGIYSTRTPPEPHPDFEEIVVVGYPGVGICTVRGIGRTIENDAGGNAVRASVDELAEALATKYGTPERIDACSGGDIQCESQFWMMTLLQGQRSYGARWRTANAEMRRNHIGSLLVVARAPNISASVPVIEYQSDNVEGCRAAERRQRASAL
jgi:hypothetical protein